MSNNGLTAAKPFYYLIPPSLETSRPFLTDTESFPWLSGCLELSISTFSAQRQRFYLQIINIVVIVITLCISNEFRGYKMGSNRDRFVRLAESRVNKAIKSIRLIGNLSNKNNYSYTDKDAKQIIRALDKELRALKSRFESDSEEAELGFSLDRD